MLLDAGNSAWLFPGRGGAAKGVAAFRGSISGCLMRHCGLAMNPHLLRHAASKLYLAARPGDLETVRQLNSHRSIETTRAFYAGSDMPAAAARYSEVIAGLRSEGSNSRATPTRKSSRKKRS